MGPKHDVRPRELIVATGEEFAGIAARRIASAIQNAVTESGVCTLALAGGSTPSPVYIELARLPVTWPAVHVFLGDERAVPPTHAESNFRMVDESLLQRLSASPAGVHRMEAEHADLGEAARRYADLLPDRLHVLVLGMGADGHTASLFPASPALREEPQCTVCVTRAPDGRPRMSLSPRVIRAARTCIVLVRGAEKAERVARALEGPVQPLELPVQLARGGIWVLDRAAAARLKNRR